jgi:RimJ/RimL family protein N-acetyltransferase
LLRNRQANNNLVFAYICLKKLSEFNQREDNLWFAESGAFLALSRSLSSILMPMNVREILLKRFVLTKMTSGDGDKYYRLSNNDKVMKYVTGYSLTREESDKMLRDIVNENAPDSFFGRYLIEDRQTGRLIGVAKLDESGEDTEIGYRIQEEEWGKGIATEIALGLIWFSREKLGATNVIAYVNVENAASIRVLEKAGMTLMERIEDLDEVKYKFSYKPKRNRAVRKALYIILDMFRHNREQTH